MQNYILKICVYQVLGNSAGDQLHAMFATLVPDFPSPYQGMGLTALAALTPDTTVREWLLMSLCIVVDFFPFLSRMVDPSIQPKSAL